MSESSVRVSGVAVAGALLGALAALLAVKLQRPSNICGMGPDGRACTLLLIHPLPIWAWVLAACIGALVGYLIAVVGRKAIQHYI